MDCIWLQTQKLNGLFQQRWLISETRMAVDVVLLIVLFVCLIFFSLSARMKESVSPEVELKSVEPEILELLLEYIYTSQ